MRHRILLLGLGAFVIWAMPVMAFHDDGVAHCDGCHTMHNSEGGVGVNENGQGTDPGVGYNDLLLWENKTDVCLGCHGRATSGYAVWSLDPKSPQRWNRGGGDFVFLEETNINDGHRGASNPIPGHESGHSVISAVKTTVADPVLSTAPGGGYPSADLHCTSCHDPHGTSAFRLTYMDGQSTTSDTGFVVNWGSTIEGTSISVFSSSESTSNHNVYKSGYSDWCGECHNDFHASSGNMVHPSGEFFEEEQVRIYNSYQGTTDCLNFPVSATNNDCGSGTYATAYFYMVPFEDATDRPTSSPTGASDGTTKVACMSCHRAHATSAPNAGRWDFAITGLAEDGHESGSFKMHEGNGGTSTYHDAFQRSLCNKCHAQDQFDEPLDFTPSDNGPSTLKSSP